MSEAFEGYSKRVTQGDDGVYRWHYDMDMAQNKSMLYMLEKINLFTFLGVTAFGALFTGLMARDFRASIVRGIVVIGLAMLVGMALLYWIGFYIAAWIKGGRYRVRYAMDEDGIELVWSARLKEGFAAGRKALVLAGAVMGSRSVRGRWRPTLDEVSKTSFSAIIRVKSYPKWDMIDLSMLGGKFQVYVDRADYDRVLAYIQARVSPKAR